MKCNNCGNKLNGNEKFCGKCGTKINNEILEEKKTISIKFNTLIIIISIVLLLFVVVVFAIRKENTNDNLQENSNQASSSENKNRLLSIIDEEKKEFKINIKELANAIIIANDEMEEENRDIIKTKMEYQITTRKDETTNEDVTIYVIQYKNYSQFLDPPIMLVANTTTQNVYRIFVGYPYLNGYGTEMNTAAILKNYNILNRALLKLNQNDLYDTIASIDKYMADLYEAGDKTARISSDWNMNGVYVGSIDGSINNDGNLSGYYRFYGAK